MFKKYSSVFARLQNETPFSAVTFRQTHHKLEMSEIKHVLDRPVFRTLAQQHSTQWKTAFSLQIPGLNRVVAAACIEKEIEPQILSSRATTIQR